MKEHGSFRWTKKDLVYNETNKKMKLELDVEFLDMDVDDKALIMLAIDALAVFIEENNADPKILFKECLNHRIVTN